MLVLGLLGLITSLLHGPEDEKYSLKGALTRVEAAVFCAAVFRQCWFFSRCARCLMPSFSLVFSSRLAVLSEWDFWRWQVWCCFLFFSFLLPGARNLQSSWAHWYHTMHWQQPKLRLVFVMQQPSSEQSCSVPSVEVAIFLGFASAVVDNVPLVAAAQAQLETNDCNLFQDVSIGNHSSTHWFTLIHCQPGNVRPGRSPCQRWPVESDHVTRSLGS